MKKILSLTLFLFSLVLWNPLVAQETKGLVDEYIRVETYNRNNPISAEKKKKNFSTNLTNGLRYALSKKFPPKTTELNDLKFEDIQFEKVPKTLKYYLKYKDYFVFLQFANDPELFIQSPIEESVERKPAGYTEAQNHRDDPASATSSESKN